MIKGLPSVNVAFHSGQSLNNTCHVSITTVALTVQCAAGVFITSRAAYGGQKDVLKAVEPVVQRNRRSAECNMSQLDGFMESFSRRLLGLVGVACSHLGGRQRLVPAPLEDLHSHREGSMPTRRHGSDGLGYWR